MLKNLFLKLETLIVGALLKLTETEQVAVDDETPHLALYHFPSCPFCVKVRWVINKLNLRIELRDIHRNREHERELILKGGHLMVPCLRIEDGKGAIRWLYESTDIIRYFVERFGQRKKRN